MNKQEYYRKLEYLIGKYFAYFNGRVNTFNKAVLKIEWCRGRENIAGKTYAPNVVIIRPLVLIDVSENTTGVLFRAVETIIHELYHVDQYYLISILDPEYVKYQVEDPVEAMTALYMISNARQIENFINVPLHEINLQLYFSTVNYNAVSEYIRLNFRSYMVKVFSNFTTSNFIDFIDLMKTANNPTVIININNTNIFLAIDRGNYASLDQFNQFMYDNVYKYYHFLVSVGYFIEDDDTCVIAIVGKMYNELCVISEEV